METDKEKQTSDSTHAAAAAAAGSAAAAAAAADESQPQDEVDMALVPEGTVFADPQSFTVKHPLQNRWTLWYDNPGKKTSQSSWADHLRKIVTVDTVEDFWGLYNNVLPASQLGSGANYHLFKEPAEPKWEDPLNEKGGKWVHAMPAKARKDNLDRMWLWLLLACIGEFFEDETEVCGCVVSVRRAQDKLALWTKHYTHEAATKRIGSSFKQALELPASTVVCYQAHSDCLKRNSSFNNKSRYEV